MEKHASLQLRVSDMAGYFAALQRLDKDVPPRNADSRAFGGVVGGSEVANCPRACSGHQVFFYLLEFDFDASPIIVFQRQSLACADLRGSTTDWNEWRWGPFPWRAICCLPEPACKSISEGCKGHVAGSAGMEYKAPLSGWDHHGWRPSFCHLQSAGGVFRPGQEVVSCPGTGGCWGLHGAARPGWVKHEALPP